MAKIIAYFESFGVLEGGHRLIIKLALGILNGVYLQGDNIKAI